MAGLRIVSAASGLKRNGGPDLLLAELAQNSTIAGIFTRSNCYSAPVAWCRAALGGGKVRAIVVNSGNANAFTGLVGERIVEHTVEMAARLFGCPATEIFVASTGVIGEQLAIDQISSQLPALHGALNSCAWEEAASAIMTTDTFPKAATRTALIGGTTVTITGITKGSGMIAPDMATVLGFLFTDARIPAPVLQKLLVSGSERSYNSITVDSDTSTSDTVLLCATGASQQHQEVQTANDTHLRDFRYALDELLVDLATQVVKDGEGAQKFITIDVSGAVSARAARKIGLTIANSPLVKTAIAGEDANWGRIVMAVGKSGEKANRDRLAISIGGILITEDGQLCPGYDERLVTAHLIGKEVNIAVDVGVGRGKARVWTCDLTHEYVAINADYRS